MEKLDYYKINIKYALQLSIIVLVSSIEPNLL